MCLALSDRRYWIGVAAKDHVEKGVAGGFCMFAHGKQSAVKRLNPGDRFAYYAPMTGMGTGDIVRAFVAIGEILPGEPETQQMGETGAGWRRAARYFTAHDAGIYLLRPQLSFVTDQSHWGMYFRRSLFAIKPQDFELIAEAMGTSIH
jgi:EVE domain